MSTVCELNTGMMLSNRQGIERQRMTDLLRHLTVLYPDKSFPILYGEAAAALLSAGTPIPVMDLLIGVSAKAWGLPVLTRDTRHFEHIPGLMVEGY
jgi:tRNA(fMet)-specific endonuclease VapC